MESRKSVVVIYIICGILGTFLFVFAGYIISAAIYISDNDLMSFFDGLMYVLSDPFRNYFNQYSILAMFVGFLLFETIYFIALTFGRSSGFDEDDEVFSDSSSSASEDSIISDNELFDGLLAGGSKNCGNNLDMDLSGDIIENDPSFESSIMDDLFSNGYQLDQITAMLPIKKYIPNVTSDILMRCFKQSMDPVDISSHIDEYFS